MGRIIQESVNSLVYYTCGQPGHFKRNYPSARGNIGGAKSQVASTAPPPVGTTSAAESGRNRSTLSYVTPYMAVSFGFELEDTLEPFYITTPVGDSIIARRVKDSSTVSPSLQSLAVVNEFLKFFPDDLPGIPSDRETNFGIDLLLNTQAISILTYRMALTELKELKEQLKDLLDKCFIHPKRAKSQAMEKVKVIREQLKVAQSLQKSYADIRRRELEFEVDDWVFLKDSLSYKEEPVAILDHQVQNLRSKVIASVKVLWNNHNVEKVTWELKNDIRARYPSLFESVDDDMEVGHHDKTVSRPYSRHHTHRVAVREINYRDLDHVAVTLRGAMDLMRYECPASLGMTIPGDDMPLIEPSCFGIPIATRSLVWVVTKVSTAESTPPPSPSKGETQPAYPPKGATPPPSPSKKETPPTSPLQESTPSPSPPKRETPPTYHSKGANPPLSPPKKDASQISPPKESPLPQSAPKGKTPTTYPLKEATPPPSFPPSSPPLKKSIPPLYPPPPPSLLSITHS
ncbi:putative LRR receptor-like serine/threonine-protein kinase-like [Capsicum annuum]|nr:putative LRR receptor-like serine/threonine-protein kinase-like [Capsicum annuum]